MKHLLARLRDLLLTPLATARRRLRLLGLVATLAAVVALAAGPGGWAGPAQAQTVPTLTFTPGAVHDTPQPSPRPATATPTQPAPTESPTAMVTLAPSDTPSPAATGEPPTPPTGLPPAGASACGSPSAFATRSNLSATLNLGFASLTLLGNQGQTAPDTRPLLLRGWEAAVIPAAVLPPLPPGWTALTCDVQVWATALTGAPVNYVRDGLVVCFNPPAGGSVVSLRVATWDRREVPARWALYAPIELHQLVCSPMLRSLGLFMLLGPAS